MRAANWNCVLADHYDCNKVMIRTQLGCVVLLVVYIALFPVLSQVALFDGIGHGWAAWFKHTYFRCYLFSWVSRLADKPCYTSIESFGAIVHFIGKYSRPIIAGAVFSFVLAKADG